MKSIIAAAFTSMLICFATLAPSAEVPFDQARFDAAIVVFKNGKESARSTGDTQRDSLAALLRHAVS
jgi:hypothetical protein